MSTFMMELHVVMDDTAGYCLNCSSCVSLQYDERRLVGL